MEYFNLNPLPQAFDDHPDTPAPALFLEQLFVLFTTIDAAVDREAQPRLGVLIHCAAGANRSAAVATAVCMRMSGCAFWEAQLHLQRCRGLYAPSHWATGVIERAADKIASPANPFRESFALKVSLDTEPVETPGDDAGQAVNS
jgi:hypothetical protein